jgi:DNA-3-methyladenine glycosylase
MKLLTREFYAQDTIDVARALLGKLLVHEGPRNERLVGRITETEAYLGAEDPAAHSYGARKTERVKSMYLAPGHSYVYFIYGMHFCLNVVTAEEGVPEAVLIRALQPIEGQERMMKNRGRSLLKGLTDGPGKLCRAMGIDSRHNGLDLTTSELKIFDDGFRPDPASLLISERVGLGAGSGDALHWPLRFRLQDGSF